VKTTVTILAEVDKDEIVASPDLEIISPSNNLAPMLQNGMVIDKKYRLESKLGEGGMGSVFRARRLVIDDFVAIKFVRPEILANPDMRQRFYQEAQVAARIKHPNVVTVHDFGETASGLVYLVMEFLEGMSLGEILKQYGPLPLERVLDVGIQICEALTCMLQNNVIHRDLKPDNIMLVKGANGVEQVKVVDFGVAKILASNSRLTRFQARIGSPVYSSPEQYLGKPVDHRTDLYGLGIIFYECLTGQVPFEALSETELLTAIVHKMPPRLDEKINGFAVLVADLVHWLLAKDPNDRPYSAAQVSNCLRTLRQSKKTLQLYQRGYASDSFKPALPPSMNGRPRTGFLAVPETTPPPIEDENFSSPFQRQREQAQAMASDSPQTKRGATTKKRATSRRASSPPVARTRKIFRFIFVSVLVVAGLLGGGMLGASYTDLSPQKLLGVLPSLETIERLVHFEKKSNVASGTTPARASRSSPGTLLSRAGLDLNKSVRLSSDSTALASQSMVTKDSIAENAFRQRDALFRGNSNESGSALKARLSIRSTSEPKIAADTEVKTPVKPVAKKREAGSAAAVPRGMVRIRETVFMLGDVFGDGATNEKPPLTVRVGDFFIAKHEVTNREYFAFVKATGRHLPEWMEPASRFHYKNGSDEFYKQLGAALYNPEHPVVGVSWINAMAYCEWLSQNSSWRYRLPTEAEWEVAARGGEKKRKYSWGDGPPQLVKGGNVADESLKQVFSDLPVIWRDYDDSHVYTSPVGKFGANAAGLCDMTGNVWEWCADWYDESYYQKKVLENPTGPARGDERVIRGGSWSDSPVKLRISYRRGMSPTFRSNNLGFRVVVASR